MQFRCNQRVWPTTYNSNGEALWGTYFGGSGFAANEFARDIETDGNGDVYVTGVTTSSDLLITPTNNSSFGGVEDAWVAKFSGDGNSLLFSAYIGGNARDDGYDLAIDPTNEHLYVVGFSQSNSGFPTETKSGGYNQVSNLGDSDGFIVEFDEEYNQVWGTFFGGDEDENFSSIEISSNGKIFISGSTTTNIRASDNPGNTPCNVPINGAFPDCSPAGAYEQNFGSSLQIFSDAIIVEFDEAGRLTWSTYFGGVGTENSLLNKNRLIIDPTNNSTVYFIGKTGNGNGIPVTSDELNPFLISEGAVSGNSDIGLIAKFENRELDWCTLFGSTNDASQVTINGGAFDSNGNLIITGRTQESNPASTSFYCAAPNDGVFPICDPSGLYFQEDGSGNAQYGGGLSDGFIAAFNQNDEILWSTYFGGANEDQALDIVYDNLLDRIYLAGVSRNTSNFPLENPGNDAYFQGTFGGGNGDGYIARFGPSGFPSSIFDFNTQKTEIITVFPNPTNAGIQFELENFDGLLEVRIYNSLGALVLKRNVDGPVYSIDLPKLPSGNYYIRTGNARNIYYSSFIIIQ